MKEGSDEESDEGGNNEPKMGLYVRRYDVCLTVPPNLCVNYIFNVCNTD